MECPWFCRWIAKACLHQAEQNCKLYKLAPLCTPHYCWSIPGNSMIRGSIDYLSNLYIPVKPASQSSGLTFLWRWPLPPKNLNNRPWTNFQFYFWYACLAEPNRMNDTKNHGFMQKLAELTFCHAMSDWTKLIITVHTVYKVPAYCTQLYIIPCASLAILIEDSCLKEGWLTEEYAFVWQKNMS